VTDETSRDDEATQPGEPSAAPDDTAVPEAEAAPAPALADGPEHLPATTRTVVLEVPADQLYTGATSAEDREWTHDALEKSFLGACGRGYVAGLIVIWILTFLVLRIQATDWGVAAAVAGAFVVGGFAGILGGVVLVGIWAMHNEEAIRGNESGHGVPAAQAEASGG
jgi:hypothetical protein